MSTVRFLVSLCFSAALYAQLPHFNPNPLNSRDDLGPDIPAVMPLVPDWPTHPAAEPISGVVSLRELQHPISEKALRAAYEAQQASRANHVPKAIAKLKKAIRLDPSYRDAHWNLGVQYTRVGRTADARAEFQKALDIGPPATGIYSNLALTSEALGELGKAGAFARKALELDPGNSAAWYVLKDVPQ